MIIVHNILLIQDRSNIDVMEAIRTCCFYCCCCCLCCEKPTSSPASSPCPPQLQQHTPNLPPTAPTTQVVEPDIDITVPSKPETPEPNDPDVPNAEPTTTSTAGTALKATILAPATAVAGSTIDVDWTGPNNDGDYLGVSLADQEGYIFYTYLSGNHPVKLLMPAEPGWYDIKYIMERHNNKILAKKSIMLTPASASLLAPATAMAGTTIAVSWSGPNNDGDYIGIARHNETGYLKYAYCHDNPVRLITPPDAGDYDIKYMMERHNNKVLATCSIRLEEAKATIQAPTTAVAGSTIQVQWTGPDNDSDYLGISKADEDGYMTYAYFRGNRPLQFTVPADLDPGNYDLKYMMEHHDNRVLAKHRIQMVPKN